MWNNKWSVVAAVLCLHCGGSAQSAAPVEEPETETPATPAEETPAEGAASGEEPSTPEKSEEGSSAGGTAAPSEKKACKELDKSTCKITQGCGWNDVHKCVEEGAQE
jgi:hypothetical protein